MISTALDALLTRIRTKLTYLSACLYRAPYTRIDSDLGRLGRRYCYLDAELEGGDLSGISTLLIESEGEALLGDFVSSDSDLVTISIVADGLLYRTSYVVGSATIDIVASGLEGLRGDSEIYVTADGGLIQHGVITGSPTVDILADGDLIPGLIATGSGDISIYQSGYLSALESILDGDAGVGLGSFGTIVRGINITGGADIIISSVGGVLTGLSISSSSADIGILAAGNLQIYKSEGSFSILVLNTKTKALTQYSNYGFNSLCHYNSTYLGAKGSQIYKLTGQFDDTSQIRSYIVTPILDISNGIVQLLNDIWVVGRSTGKLILTVEWDEKYIAKDVIRYLKKSIDEARVVLPKGMRGRLYNFKIENSDGSAFDLSSIRILGSSLTGKRLR